MDTFKPTLNKPTPQGANFQNNAKKINTKAGLKLNETDGLLNEVEQSLKKKIFSLAKMEALVFSDPKLMAKYEEMAENGEERFGYHYNETIQNMLFNDYVLNSPKYLQKYKQAIPKEKTRRDQSGINQLKKAGEKNMQHKTDIKPEKLAPTGLKPAVAESEEPLTKVEFLVNEREPKNPDLFAYFPEENYDNEGKFKTAYSHVGQHSSASPEYAKESRPATPEEYAPLKTELESLGYNLEVVNGVNEETGSGSSGAYSAGLGMISRTIAEEDKKENVSMVDEMTGTGGGGGGGESGSGAYYTPKAFASNGDLLHGSKKKAPVKTVPMIKGGTIIQESNYLIETDGFEKYIQALNEDENINNKLGQVYQATHSKSNKGLGVSELQQSPERDAKIREIEDNTMLFLGQDLQHSPDDDVEIFHKDMTEPHTLIPHPDNKIPQMQTDGIVNSIPRTSVGLWDKIRIGDRKETPEATDIEQKSGDGYGDLGNMSKADINIIDTDVNTEKLDKPNLRQMEESKQIKEVAKSKEQQRLFGMAHAVQKGELSPSKVGGAVKKIAKTVDPEDVEDFASTKHKGLPEKVKKLNETDQSIIGDKQDSISNKSVPTNTQGGNVPMGMQNTGGGSMNESAIEVSPNVAQQVEKLGLNLIPANDVSGNGSIRIEGLHSSGVAISAELGKKQNGEIYYRFSDSNKEIDGPTAQKQYPQLYKAASLVYADLQQSAQSQQQPVQQPMGMQNNSGGAMNESDIKLLEELDNELKAYSIHHKKLMKMSEDKKPASLILKDRLGDENKANFKKDLQHSGTKEIIDVEKELEWKDQQTDVGKDPQKLGAEIEAAEIKATDAKSGQALKNVGDSANFKGDEIPKRNLTTEEQEEVNMYRNGQHSWVYDNEPNEAFEKRMKADMGDTIYDMRQKQLAFKGKAPMYNKVAQPIQDTKAERAEFDKEKSGWNERVGLKESMVTGRYLDALNKRRLIDFKLNEVKIITTDKLNESLFEIDFTGLGNTYDSKTINNKVVVNEAVVNVMNENKFFTDGKTIFAVKNPVQKLNENEQKDKKRPINEQFEKMKHLTGYNTNDFINTKGIKL